MSMWLDSGGMRGPGLQSPARLTVTASLIVYTRLLSDSCRLGQGSGSWWTHGSPRVTVWTVPRACSTRIPRHSSPCGLTSPHPFNANAHAHKTPSNWYRQPKKPPKKSPIWNVNKKQLFLRHLWIPILVYSSINTEFEGLVSSDQLYLYLMSCLCKRYFVIAEIISPSRFWPHYKPIINIYTL